MVRKSKTSTRKNKLAQDFCSCIKQVRKSVQLRPGQPKTAAAKEAAAIGICVKSVLQTRGKTLKRFSCGEIPMIKTQGMLKTRKMKGGNILPADTAVKIEDAVVAANGNQKNKKIEAVAVIANNKKNNKKGNSAIANAVAAASPSVPSVPSAAPVPMPVANNKINKKVNAAALAPVIEEPAIFKNTSFFGKLKSIFGY